MLLIASQKEMAATPHLCMVHDTRRRWQCKDYRNYEGLRKTLSLKKPGKKNTLSNEMDPFVDAFLLLFSCKPSHIVFIVSLFFSLLWRDLDSLWQFVPFLWRSASDGFNCSSGRIAAEEQLHRSLNWWLSTWCRGSAGPGSAGANSSPVLPSWPEGVVHHTPHPRLI